MGDETKQLQELLKSIADAIREQNKTVDLINPQDFAQQILELPVADLYTGTYEIVPRAEETQELNTKDKRMSANVVVKAIPEHRTTNPSGGDTFTIASTSDEISIN